MTLNIRPATEQDIIKINGCVPMRVYAFVAEEDGETVAVGGFCSLPVGGVMMFLDITPEVAQKYPVTLIKMFKRCISLAQSLNRPHIYAMPQDDRGEVATRFLERLGFRQTEDGGVYHYEN